MRFTIEDNIERHIECLNDVIIDYVSGYNLFEDENREDEVIVYFEDINKDGEVMKRYFDLPRKELPDFKNTFKKYGNNYEKRYKKMLDLKSPQPEDIYNQNKLFFIASNISLKEWIQFNN